MVGTRTTLYASSRTDAGVHARAMPVLFYTDNEIPLHGYKRGLNTLLPDDVSVLDAVEVSQDFNVRKSACRKTYHYTIWNHPTRAALYTRRAWNIPVALDYSAMQAAADLLIGVFDFSSFRAADCQANTPVRSLVRVDVNQSQAPLVTICVEGNAFLQHMVRIIAGTLVEVGKGRQPVAWVKKALDARDRNEAGPTAPPQGLCLERVHYEPPPFDHLPFQDEASALTGL
jgi:tRNA pseudouridine38-40 synthase